MNAPLKEVFAPHLGRTVKMGRRPPNPVLLATCLRIGDYLDHSVLPPSPDCDYTALAAAGLADVLKNDVLSNCTCAGAGHLIDVVNCNAGTIVRVTDEEIVRLYEESCGYRQDDPSTDQGGNELTVLDYVSENGIDGKGLHKFVGSVLIDGTNKAEVRWCQWALGNTYFGESMPREYVDPMPQSDGVVWDVAGPPDPENGHAFTGVGSTAVGIKIATWGLVLVQTYEAIAMYAKRESAGGELHTVLTKEWLSHASQKTPSGFAYDDLVSDLKRIGRLVS